jgi:type II secretory pathway component GspD/PulD (secretin)/tetratricopeptide (TPR) repeat protein
MMKAVTLPLALTLLLAAIPASDAQTQPQDAAINEAVYRQAYRISLRQKLADARAAQDRHALPTAAKLYDDAWELVQKIGSGVDAERDQTVVGLAAVRLELARAAQRHGDYKEARTQVDDVLRVDPTNAAAIEFKSANEKLLAEQRGKIPSEEVRSQVPAIIEEKVKASTLVHDGKLLFEMGKLDEAESKLKMALKQDPHNEAALYYLNLVSEAKYTQASKLHEVTLRQDIRAVEQAWANPVSRDALPVPNPYARTNLVYTGHGRQTIISKLDRIRLDSVKYDGLPLGEVIINLNDEAKKRDPEKRGINFLLNQNVDSSGPTLPGIPQLGPDGQPLPTAAPAEQVDMTSIAIKINPALTDIRLADVLDAIVKVADRPIKYSIEDYAVIFSLKAREEPPLYVRTFKIDPNTFYQGLQNVGAMSFGYSYNVGNSSSSSGGMGGGMGGMGGGMGGMGGGMGGMGGGMGGMGGMSGGMGGGGGAMVARVTVAGGMMGGMGGGMGGGMMGGGMMGGGGLPGAGGTTGVGGTTGMGGGMGGTGGGGLRFITQINNESEVSQAAINYFQAMGVDLSPRTNPGKAVFFNDRQGVLLVRATLQDLDMIEAAVQILNIVPPQVNIKSKIVEVTQDDTKALGFDWYLGNVLMNGGSIVGSGGTQPSLNGTPTAANPLGTFPGNTAAGTTIAPTSTDGQLTSGLRNTSTTLFTLTGILTDPQFRMVIHALQQRQGAEMLAEPEVTTQSGRQAQMKATDVKTIITAYNFSQNNTATGASVGTGTTVQAPAATFVYPMPEQMELGPTLDVIPCVLSDGFTINLTLIPTLMEFVGYDNPNSVNTGALLTSGAFPGGLVQVPVVLPLFRVRQVVSAVNVWDGQTVVLGGLLSETVSTIKDQVPMLGDLPLIGRFFQSESKSTSKANLLIFVTPTLIDPSGNRLHTDEEMPFAQTGFPSQTAAASGQEKAGQIKN